VVRLQLPGRIGAPEPDRWIDRVAVPIEPAESPKRVQYGLAIPSAVFECADYELGRSAGLVDSGEKVTCGDALDRRVRQRDPDLAVGEVGALGAVEGDQGQRRGLGRELDLRLTGEPGENHEVRIVDAVRARQMRELQLSVELAAIVVRTRHHQRTQARGAEVARQPARHLGVARDQPQDGPAVARGIVTARLIVARHAGPGGDWREQREPGRGGDLDGLGDSRRPVGADQGQRIRVPGRQLGRLDRSRRPMRDMADPRRFELRLNGAGEQLRKYRMDHRAESISAASRLPEMGKRSRRRGAAAPPTSTTDYADADGNVLTLRDQLSAGTVKKIAQLDSTPAASAEDRWQRRAELLFERLAVRWTIAGLPLESQKDLLGRYRMASGDERAWIRETIEGHLAQRHPELSP
jgi:hypothetical protein